MVTRHYFVARQERAAANRICYSLAATADVVIGVLGNVSSEHRHSQNTVTQRFNRVFAAPATVLTGQRTRPERRRTFSNCTAWATPPWQSPPDHIWSKLSGNFWLPW